MHAAVSPIAESPEASEEGSRAGTPASEPAAHPAPAAGSAASGHPSVSGTAGAAPVHAVQPPARLPEELVGEAGRDAERLAPGYGARPAPDIGPSLLAEEEKEEDGSEAAEPSGAAEGVAAQNVPDRAAALLAREEDEEEGGEGGLARLTEQLRTQLVLDAAEPLLAAEEEEDEDDGDAAAAAAAAGEPVGVAEQQSTQLALDATDPLLAAEEDEEEEEQAAGPAIAAAAGDGGAAAAAGAPAGPLAGEDDEDAAELTPLQQLMRMCCQEVRGKPCSAGCRKGYQDQALWDEGGTRYSCLPISMCGNIC